MMTKRKWIHSLCVIAAIALVSSPSLAVISQQFFISDNNKLYYVISSNPSAGEAGTQVTSLVMSSGVAIPVSETSNNPPDPVVTSFSTFLTGAFLNAPPLSNILRSGIITDLVANTIEDLGNPLNGVFDPFANGGNGLLTLPGGTRTVTFDGSGTEPVVAITSTTGAGETFVPAATNITITRRIGATTFMNAPTLVFPNPAGAPVTSNGATCVGGGNPGAPCDPSNGNADCTGGGTCTNFGGETAGQNVTLDDTLGSRVGNPASQGASVDGFFIGISSQIIVFMVDDGAATFGLASTGFSVSGADLTSRNVINTTGDVDNGEFKPTPTNTPTPTGMPPTATPTNSPSATGTVTATPSAASTLTATASATPTSTVTDTPTSAATATATSTSTVTQTATSDVSTATTTPTNTPTPEVQVTSVPAGGSATTDTEGDGATAADPLETTITSPNAGPVSITETSASVLPPPGFTLVGQVVDINAPPATAASPLVIAFEIAAAAIPAGSDQDSIQVLKDGVLVPACTGAAGVASPDPCVASRQLLANGNVQITVLTSNASLWSFAVRQANAPCAGLRGVNLAGCKVYCEVLDCDAHPHPPFLRVACRVLRSLIVRRTGEPPPCELASGALRIRLTNTFRGAGRVWGGPR
jgi:hypothetical protein